MPKEDLTTQRFGKLTVIQASSQRLYDCVAWECICDCGKSVLVTTSHLKTKHRRSCGCYVPYIDMAGQKIGALTVLQIASRGETKGVLWECRCDCGTICYVTGPHLRDGRVNKSCGCLRRAILEINIRKAIATRRKSDEEADMRYLLTSYKHGAKDRGLAWELSVAQFWAIIRQPCRYCGIPPFQSRNAERYRNTPYNGIDRVDNSQGYTLDNAVPCCFLCNQAKSTRNADEFCAWILRAATHLSQQSDSNVGTFLAQT